jgi:hypothetical protein
MKECGHGWERQCAHEKRQTLFMISSQFFFRKSLPTGCNLVRKEVVNEAHKGVIQGLGLYSGGHPDFAAADRT